MMTAVELINELEDSIATVYGAPLRSRSQRMARGMS